MKNRVFILSFLILLITINFAFAQTTTKKVSYQAVVRNAANELVTNESLSVEITILNANNVPQYRETHASVSTNQNGLLWLWVGEGTPTLGTLEEVIWKDATIRSVFTLPGGNTVTQNTPVSAMPYAYYADEVDTLFLQNYLTSHNYGNEDYVTHEQLDDTLSRYTTTDKIDTLLGVYFDSTRVKTTIHDTADAIRAAIPATQVNADWNATGGPAEILNKPDLSVYATKDTLNAFATKDTLAYYATTNALKDSLSQYVGKSKLNDTLDRYYTKDNVDSKLNDYEKKSDLCGDVKECIKDTLSKYTTTDKIDTLLGVYFDSTKVKTAIHDSLTQNVELTIKSDSLFLKSGGDIDTVKLPAVPEQVKSDWKETNTASAAYILNKPVIKDSVNMVVKDSLAAPNSAINQAVDTIARHNISDSTRMVFDSLHTYYATKEALKDTATAIRHDICDSATTCITKALADANSDINHAVDTIARNNIHDTAMTIRNSIGNGQITIRKNGATITDGSFYLNQKTDQTINITVPTQTSELTNNSNLAYTTGNTFSGAHDFTSSGTTITVPSNEDAIKRPVPTTTPATECTNMNAVNVCDLLAVFDSLTKRMDQMQETINGLRDSLQNVMPKLSLVANPTAGVICGENPATIAYTANITNGNVADYQFKWTVNGTDSTSETGPILTCKYTTNGENNVVCTATSDDHLTMKDSITLNVTTGIVPDFSITVNSLIVTLTTASEIDTIAWGDGTGTKTPASSPVPHEYLANGAYTISMKNTTGCVAEKKVTVKYGVSQDRLTPCSVTSAHTDSSTYTAETGGFETLDEDGKVIRVQDQDGHEYFVTQIGTGSSTQCWMAENLRSKRYSSSLFDTTSLISLSSPYNNDKAYYGYPNNVVANEETYGLLYNWTAAMGGNTLEGSQGICPDGWHMPKKSDIDMMITSVEASAAAGKLAGGLEGSWETSENDKTPGNYDNYSERNSSGFSALPAGMAEDNTLTEFGTKALIWTSTFQDFESTGGLPSYYYLELIYNYNQAKCHDYVGVSNSLSVRCIRDAEGSTPVTNPTVTTSSATIGTDGVTLNGEVSANGNTISEKGFEWKIVGESVNRAQVPSENSFTYNLNFSVLTVNTYNYRAYAMTNGSTYYGEWEEFVITPSSLPFICGISKMIDASGNSYETDSIGGQCWTKTNLRTTKKRNGDDLDFEENDDMVQAYYFKPTDSTEWLGITGEHPELIIDFSNYSDSIFGYYYNWPAAAGQGNSSICPDGWHVPSFADWSQLINFLSSNEIYRSCSADPVHDEDPTDNIAKALSSTYYWKHVADDECTPGGTPTLNNVSNFSAIPAGYTDFYSLSGRVQFSGAIADFWSSTEDENDPDHEQGHRVRINWSTEDLDTRCAFKDMGFSIRCVRDGGGGTTQTDLSVATGTANPVGETTATLSASIANSDNVVITAKGFEYTSNGTTWTSVDGTGEGNSFTADLTGLNAGTEYTYKAFITFGNQTIYGDEEMFTTTSSFTCGSTFSYHGNDYGTVSFYGNCWMAQNLRSTTYNDGTIIENDNIYSPYNGTVDQYGYLYKWNDKLCPTGWHLPIINVEIPNNGSIWNSSYNQYAGYYKNGFYFGANTMLYFWTDTNDGKAATVDLNYLEDGITINNSLSNSAASVRCVRDAE